MSAVAILYLLYSELSEKLCLSNLLSVLEYSNGLSTLHKLFAL